MIYRDGKITTDTDLDKAKKLIKQIGKDQMQGVEEFGDFAIQIRMKMMTKPGQQFTIRRRALALIKAAFAANGLKFATPTVQVAGPADAAAAAAAHQALEPKKAP